MTDVVWVGRNAASVRGMSNPAVAISNRPRGATFSGSTTWGTPKPLHVGVIAGASCPVSVSSVRLSPLGSQAGTGLVASTGPFAPMRESGAMWS